MLHYGDQGFPIARPTFLGGVAIATTWIAMVMPEYVINLWTWLIFSADAKRFKAKS